ncbi:hypothetical protein F1559_004237 [Cyanidiococcus yangmingshanensis]|uniref:Uncharacterized protein n=1 Tax=Cyanidiococcus yangmingshanensis TaxID=2690220 RepID=A0A7J7IG42_9RHOD|nr:hypothetical protein F1559_004237 [Cyanidiococcus yangmingshanensis]
MGTLRAAVDSLVSKPALSQTPPGRPRAQPADALQKTGALRACLAAKSLKVLLITMRNTLKENPTDLLHAPHTLTKTRVLFGRESLPTSPMLSSEICCRRQRSFTAVRLVSFLASRDARITLWINAPMPPGLEPKFCHKKPIYDPCTKPMRPVGQRSLAEASSVSTPLNIRVAPDTDARKPSERNAMIEHA